MLIVTALVLAACTDTGGDAQRDGPGGSAFTPTSIAVPNPTTTSTTRAPGPCPARPENCTLAMAGRAAGVRVGVALMSAQLDDPAVRDLVRTQFSQITPENELKWAQVEAEPGEFDFTAVDALVDFATAAGLETRGHTLIWGQRYGNGMPDWVAGITDPAIMESAMRKWIRTAVGRYRGRIQRWDVVNEPLANPGTGLDDSPFRRVLGDRYLDLAFSLAAAADQSAQLWINEIGVENDPARADALVELVTRLRIRGVPLHGVGLQGHFDKGTAPVQGRIRQLVDRLRPLGVEVAMTELDVVRRGDVSNPGRAQADVFAQVTSECLDGGCEELSFWGVSDAASWLDAQLGRPAEPLLFDALLQPKPAYRAVRDDLARR